MYDFCLIFTLLLLLFFGDIKKFEVILKARSAVSGLVRVRLAQPGYGSGRLPPVFPEHFSSREPWLGA